MKKIYCYFIIFISIVVFCGCQKSVDKNGEQLYVSIEANNIQGVKEALKNTEINLEKLPKSEDTIFKENDRRALGIAISNDSNVEIIGALIEKGADVSPYFIDTLVMNNYDVCAMLLEAGADITNKNDEGKTAVDVWFEFQQDECSNAEGNDIWPMAELMLQHGGTFSEKTIAAYLEADGYACGKKIIEEIYQQDNETGLEQDIEYAVLGEDEKLLNYLRVNDISDPELLSRYAAANCNAEVLNELKRRGCDFDVRDNQGQTLVHIAAKYNEKDALAYFVEKNYSLSKLTEFYQLDVLSMAVLGGKEQNVELLLKQGIHWQQEGAGGSDVWIAACQAGNPKSIQILIDNGFVPTAEEIVYGYENCDENIFYSLLEYGISYKTEFDGETGFSLLCFFEPDFALKLLAEDKDLEITPQILERTINSYNYELSVMVINKAADVNVTYTMSPLEMAVVTGQFEVVKHLVQNGANINYQLETEDGETHTVLHTAAENPSLDIVRYLVEKGGDISVKDSEGKIPYERAVEAKMDRNKSVLKK